MIGTFSTLRSLISVNPVSIDNGVFVMHYKVTVVLLLLCTIIISTKQYFGDPITCLSNNVDVKFNKAIDTFCFIHSTYTVNELMDGKIGSKVLRPGVGPHNARTTPKYHKYYIWTGFFLMFQAWMFYFPRFLWKLWEGGKMKNLSLNMQNEMNFREKELVARRKIVANYLIRNFHSQNCYAVRYVFCEFLNVLNIGAQMVITDAFLGHQFSSYGTDVFNYLYYSDQQGIIPNQLRSDPMDKVFPKLSKCIFNQFGPSGNVIGIDVLCVLPLNVLNEKIFIFLWFWFIIIATISVLGIIYRIATILFAPIRRCRLESKASLCDLIELHLISRHCNFADWLILHQLSKNMDPMIYTDLLKDIALKLKKNCSTIRQHSYSPSSYINDSSTTIRQQEFNSEPLYDCVPMEETIA